MHFALWRRLIRSFTPSEVPNDVFSLLCRLEYFDLSGNGRLDKSTVAGYLACRINNPKDAKMIDVSNQGLKGEWYL